MKRVLPLLVLAIIIITGCKKDSDITGTVSNGQPVIPNGAAGAFYAIRNNINTKGLTSSTYSALAWFGNSSNTQYVNSLTVNGSPMVDSASGEATGWYEVGLGIGSVYLGANAVNWVTDGNTSLSIPAFNYNDTTSFPLISWFTLPSTVSLSSTLTVNFNYVIPGTQLFVELSDALTSGAYIKSYPANTTTITFNPSEIQNIGAASGDQIAVQILAVSISSQSFAGKEYYFLKESSYAEYTILQ